MPGDISIMCSDADPTFAWSEPSVAHIRWDPQPFVRRIVAWAANVSRGKTDRRQSLTKAEFIEGQLKAYPTDLYTDAEVSAELHTLLAAAKTRE